MTYFQKIKDNAQTGLIAAATGYGIFHAGMDYGEYLTYQRLEPRDVSSLTDTYTRKACPQLAETEITLGYIKQEPDIGTPAISFIEGNIPDDVDIPVFTQSEKYQTLLVLINSPGGSVLQTDAFLQEAKINSEKIITVVDGAAASSAFMIAISGTPGFRIATADSTLMIHEAFVVAGDKNYQQSDLPYLSMERWGLIDTNEMGKDMIRNASPSLSEECINALIRPKTDLFMNTLDALKLGLIDAVVPDHSDIKIATPEGVLAMVRKGDPREIVLATGPRP